MSKEYEYLTKKAQIDESKAQFSEVLSKVFMSIQEYNILDEEDRPFVLDKLKYQLDDVIKLLSVLGYTFEPDAPTDTDEESFLKQLNTYKQQARDFIRDYDTKGLESFNVITRNIQTLVELHRTKMMKEGEVLTDLE